jgi:hypothetical protein
MELNKIKCSHAHPNALLNYLVTCSSEKRNVFFLECELNFLCKLIKEKKDYIDIALNIQGKLPLYISELYAYPLGDRGYCYDLRELDWDLDDFVKLYKKRLT